MTDATTSLIDPSVPPSGPGCVECDALIGRFHLEDLLADHRNAGGSLGQLDSGIAVELNLAPAEQRRGITAFG